MSKSKTDYCYDPNWNATTTTITAVTTADPSTTVKTTAIPSTTAASTMVMDPSTTVAATTAPITTVALTGPANALIGGQDSDGQDPEVVLVDRDYCTPQNPCPQCWGDCDKDEDCQGNLVCHQRGKYEAVPNCRNGELDDSKSDYCVLP